jgi:DNA-binding CsgD family transcriptional regulator
MAKISEQTAAEIIDLRRSGETLKQIAEKYDLTGERVRQIIKKYNATAEEPVVCTPKGRTPSPKIAERRQKVAELRRSGLTLSQVADKMGISKYTVVQDCQILQKRGELPKKGDSA